LTLKENVALHELRAVAATASAHVGSAGLSITLGGAHALVIGPAHISGGTDVRATHSAWCRSSTLKQAGTGGIVTLAVDAGKTIAANPFSTAVSAQIEATFLASTGLTALAESAVADFAWTADSARATTSVVSAVLSLALLDADAHLVFPLVGNDTIAVAVFVVTTNKHRSRMDQTCVSFSLILVQAVPFDIGAIIPRVLEEAIAVLVNPVFMEGAVTGKVVI